MSAAKEKISTKERLLIAAEKLFAERGFHDVSLRDITNEAQANVASVNYYFSSKDALEDEVITRHIGPVNEARFKALELLKETYGESPIPSSELLLAFMKPMMERMHSCSLRNDLFSKIMGRCMGDRGLALPPQVEPQMKEVIGVFIAELVKALPQLDPVTVLWRLHFSFGVVAHTLLFSDRLKEFADIADEETSMELSLKRIIDYCEAGLRAEDGMSGAKAKGEQDA